MFNATMLLDMLYTATKKLHTDLFLSSTRTTHLNPSCHIDKCGMGSIMVAGKLTVSSLFAQSDTSDVANTMLFFNDGVKL